MEPTYDPDKCLCRKRKEFEVGRRDSKAHGVIHDVVTVRWILEKRHADCPELHKDDHPR